MIDLERELRELGEHLDHPSGDRIIPELRIRLASPAARAKATARPSSTRRRRFVVAVAGVAAVLLLTVALPPGREAIEKIFGFDSADNVRPDRAAIPPHDHSTVTSGPPSPAIESLDLASARTAVDFPIGVPAGIEQTPQVAVDRRVPGGLVALAYPSFTLVEVASPPDVAPELARLIPPTSRVRIVSVRARPALWITGTHQELTYLDREGELRTWPSRPTGHVLLWEEHGVTYRVEGFLRQGSASELARSIE